MNSIGQSFYIKTAFKVTLNLLIEVACDMGRRNNNNKSNIFKEEYFESSSDKDEEQKALGVDEDDISYFMKVRKQAQK